MSTSKAVTILAADPSEAPKSDHVSPGDHNSPHSPMPGSGGALNTTVNGSASHKSSKKSSGMNTSQRTNSNGPVYLAPPQILMEGGGGFGYRGPGLIRESRRRRPWRKLLWVKQNYSDNFTDTSFLDSLQRNVNVRAYDFWPLVSDSTVIAQHLSSIVIFVTAFIAMSKDKIEPAFIAGISTFFTVIGWLIWDEWTVEEERMARFATPTKTEDVLEDDNAQLSRRATPTFGGDGASSTKGSSKTKGQGKSGSSRSRSRSRSKSRQRAPSPNPNGRRTPLSRQNSHRDLSLSITVSTPELLSPTPISASASVAASTLLSPNFSPSLPNAPSPITPTSPGLTFPGGYFALPITPQMESRSHRRLSTLKSAILIYSTLLGLSPILKSLTETTTSDSIWALSSWLFLVNLLCFDYGLSETEIGSGGEGKKKSDSSDKLNDPSLAAAHSATGTNAGTGANALSKK